LNAQSKGSNGDAGKPAAEDLKAAVPIFGVKALYVFSPVDDITAHELASCTAILCIGSSQIVTRQHAPAADILYTHLSDGAKRHFRVREYSNVILPGGPGGGMRG